MDAMGLDKPKKPNLFENAGVLSKMFYCWGVPLLVEGNKRELTEDDVCEPMDEQRSRHCEEIMSEAWEEELKQCKRSGAKPQLAKAVIRLFGPPYALICIFILMQETIPFVQVYFLYGMLDYYSRPVESRVFADALWTALGIIFCSWFKGYVVHFFTIRSSLLGMSVRLAVNTLLYGKVLRLSKARKSNISTGFIINLFAIDGKKLEMFFHLSIYLVVAPVQLLSVSILTWFVFGWPTIPGAVFSILCLPLQLWVSQKSSILRHEVVKKADIRIHLMNEIISGMQVLKMYAWENLFAEMISAARKEELKCLKKAMRYRTAAAMSFIYRSRIGIFLILLSHVIWKGDIDSVTVYVTMVLINISQVPVSHMMTKGSMYMGESLISLKRMTEFLLIEEDSGRIDDNSQEIGETLIIDTAINITGLTATWSEDAIEPVLSGVNLDFARGELTALVGVVGSGKSSLLQAIMGEMSVNKGTVFSSGRISYAAQEPWVFQGSVRDNIVFGQEFDQERYKRVIGVCALDRDITMFPNGDTTIVGERGVMLSGGQKARVGLARAVYRNADIYLLDDPLSAVDVNVGKLIFDDCIRGFLEGKTVILPTHQIQVLESVKRIVLFENGTVTTIGSISDLEGIHDNPSVKKGSRKSSYILEKDEEIENADPQDAKPDMEPEHSMLESASGTPWMYFKSGGSYWAIFLMFFIFVFTEMSGSFYDFWQFYWVKLEDHFRQSASAANPVESHNNSAGLQIVSLRHIDSTSETCLIILGATLVVMIVSAAFEVFYWAHFSTKASLTIHDKLFNAVLRAKMHFFNSNTSGRILNRFSQELSIVDELLSDLMMEFLLTGLFVIGTLVMLAIANPITIALIAVCILAIVGLKIFYVRTSTQIKKIESASRSPVIAHVNQTINGLTTIRAFGAQRFLTSEFHKYQDYNAGAQLLFIGLTRTFGFWVECVGMVYTGVVVASFLALDTGAANVGIAIFQVLALSNLLQFFMRLVVELENALSSVERTAQYASLPSEINWRQESEGDEIGCSWPDEGKISFVNANFRYHKNGPKVLDNLNFTVMPREKIGIVGRTGAGKSSLISALFRMAEVEGHIEIDDVDTSTISLHTLRSRISIIPQDPVLFSGTLRKNIDPFDEYTDDKLWTALEEVELKEVIGSLPNGLETGISEGGGNLSVGQKQLVCLARAIVRNNKILVLDEATANVDHETDALIQKTIRRKFSDNTVLTVAHRLNTVMDSDKILVISNGNAVEFDHPHVLLQNEIGHLKEMVSKCGKTTESIFRATAEENYKRKNQEG